MKFSTGLLLAFLITQILNVDASLGETSDKVKLKEIGVLTLRRGQGTTGRRSSGVEQLSCVGGTAGCSTFIVQVVKCFVSNRESDSVDVQWKCETEMDSDYRFGKIQVTCEGYDYPDDPYVLNGSCGLEYTLDFTKDGTVTLKIIALGIIFVIIVFAIRRRALCQAIIATLHKK